MTHSLRIGQRLWSLIRAHRQPNKIERRVSVARRSAARQWKVADAIKDFGDALTLDAANHFAFAARSLAHAQSKDFDKAVLDLVAARELQPELRDYAIRLAALHERRGIERHLKSEWAGAIEDYSEAVKIGPGVGIYTCDALTLARCEIHRNR